MVNEQVSTAQHARELCCSKPMHIRIYVVLLHIMANVAIENMTSTRCGLVAAECEDRHVPHTWVCTADLFSMVTKKGGLHSCFHSDTSLYTHTMS